MTPAASTNPPVIRGAAMRLFAEPGGDRTTVRDIATAAGVSPALVIRHFGSMDGLRAAVDAHVATQIADFLSTIDADPRTAVDPQHTDTLADSAIQILTSNPSLPRYVLRSLTDGGDRGTTLVDLIISSSLTTWQGLVETGAVDPGPDPRARAAVVAILDLAALALREPLAHALGDDPLSDRGAQRWTAEIARLLAPPHPTAVEGPTDD